METASISRTQLNEMGMTKQAELVSMDKVTPLDVDWLWPNHIPLGMLTLIAGDPGAGKSFLTLYMAATVSTGRPWPGSNENRESSIENRSSCGSVIILNNEDSPDKVICPRLTSLNADLSKIKAIPFVWHRDKDGNEFTDYFNIITDLLELELILSEMPDTKLIIIDPLIAFFGFLDTHKGSYVRAVLTPLSDLARKYNVAIVGVMHLNKGISTRALYRTTGSMSFPAAARTVWLVCPVSNSSGSPRRLFIPAKHNLLEKPATLAFEIKDNRVVFENQPVNIPAEAVLSSKSNIEAPELNRAIDWLKTLLADGKPLASKDIFKLSEGQCFKDITLQRARKELGIKCFPQTDVQGHKFWCWKLPKITDKQPKMLSLAELNKKMHEKLMMTLQKNVIGNEDDE
jgi:putative DNA primase/helicase